MKHIFFGVLAVLAAPLWAQEKDADNRLVIELNALEPLGSQCRMSFLVLNGFDVNLSKTVFETVLFDRQGQVDRLTLFDFGALPAGRPRLRQFLVPDLPCDSLGQVLFNGVQTCQTVDPSGEQAGGQSSDMCASPLRLKTRTDVEVLG